MRICTVCGQPEQEHTPAGSAACRQVKALERIAAALEKGLANLALAVRK